MIRLGIVFIWLSTFVYAENLLVDTNATAKQAAEKLAQTIKNLEDKYQENEIAIGALKSVWLNAYENFHDYKSLEEQSLTLKSNIKHMKRKRQTSKRKESLAILKKKLELVKNKLELLPVVEGRVFDRLLKTPHLPKAPEISNPFAIFTGFSFTKQIKQLKEDYVNKNTHLGQLLMLLRTENELLSELYYTSKETLYVKKFKQSTQKLEAFERAHEILQATVKVYKKRVDELSYKVSEDISRQAKDMFNIGIVILVFFALAFLLKMVIKKYIKDHERFYMANKIVNFVNFFIIFIILFMSYIDNVGYLVTVLGFASAGIAIAMKDWFMSVLGWIVIVVGGSIHVGDRIRFDKDGMKYVGDVLDISLFRITILEDITLTTILHNRRAGRIIFIPNNYVFTSMIANYSHNSLKTVWDGIDITITFDSNHKKASFLAKEIARKYSKGYTDITRKQLNKMRDRYSLKNTNVDPRIFVFTQANGLKVSTWYLTNAYATLTLRTTITTELIDAFNKEDDIHIAYPTQTIHYGQQMATPPPGVPMDLQMSGQ